MSLKLYYDLMSQPSRSVFLFLKLANVDFNGQLVDLKKGAHLTDEFKSVNPFQKVPAIDDNGFKLTESIAIMKYLIDKHKIEDPLYPKDIIRRTRIEEFFHWYHLNLRVNAALYFRTMFIDPRVYNKPPDFLKAKRFLTSLETNIQVMESYFLRQSEVDGSVNPNHSPTPFLCGGVRGPSIADILAVCELMQTSLVNFDVVAQKDRWPSVASWMMRVQNDTAPHFEEAHKILTLIQDRIKQSKL